MSNEIFLFAGEKSGDLLGKQLLKSLKKHLPDHSFVGVGGTEMRSEGIDCWMRMEEFQVMGFTDVILALPKIIKQFYALRKRILNTNPEAVILIDYPGFNLRMAQALRKKGYQGKIVQYISPTVWAWGKARIQKMIQSLDLLLCIYPFEESFWEKHPLSAQYVGNPIKETVQTHKYQNNWRKTFGIPDSENLIALFPGSRQREVQRHLPLQLEAAEKLKAQYPDAKFVISCAHKEIIPVMEKMLDHNSLNLHQDIFLLPKDFSYELMRDSRTAIAKSGTVTLELALHKRPTAVMYHVAGLNYFIAKYLLKLNLPYYCIVNILREKEVFPEMIEKGLSVPNIVRNVTKLHEESPERYACIEDCSKLISFLSETDASNTAAKAIAKLLS